MSINNRAKWGTSTNYGSIHDYISYHKGKPKFCLFADPYGVIKCSKRMEWANISHKVVRDINNYISLCVRHHRLYDNNMPNPYRKNKDLVRKKISESIKKHWILRKNKTLMPE